VSLVALTVETKLPPTASSTPLAALVMATVGAAATMTVTVVLTLVLPVLSVMVV
jgi:hypothetical protein